jgi:hypothetical protein
VLEECVKERISVTPAAPPPGSKLSIPMTGVFGRRKSDFAEHEEVKSATESLVWKALVYFLLFLLSVIALMVSYNVKPHVSISHGEIIPSDVTADLLSSLLKDLGIAGLVAIFLAITFERLSAREFEKIARREQSRIKHDVFRYVYGHHVPEDIRKEIHTKVLTAKFVRDTIELSYTLTPITSVNGRYMQLDLIAKYAVRNLTNRPEKYRIEPSVEKPPIPEFADRVGFRFLEITGSAEPLQRLDELQLDKKGYVTKDEISTSLKPPQPLVMPTRLTIVTVGYRSITHLDGGYDYFMFADHTCKTSIGVRVPSNDYSVALRDFGGEELMPHPVWHQPENGRFYWESETPILKNQGIYITWSPNTETEPAVAVGTDED